MKLATPLSLGLVVLLFALLAGRGQSSAPVATAPKAPLDTSCPEQSLNIDIALATHPCGFNADSADMENTDTEDDVALHKALAAASPGAIVKIAPRTYRLTSSLEVTKPLTIAGTTGSEIQLAAGGRSLLKIKSSNVKIVNLKLTGPQYSANEDQERAIEAVGGSTSAPISQIMIDNCDISSWGGYGIYLKYVNDFSVSRNRISQINYAGVQGLSVRRGMIANNVIHDIIGKHDSYGIALSRENGNLIAEPRSSDVKVIGNSVSNVPYWEALDTHGGERISFIKNSVVNAYAGIVIGVSKDGAGRAVFSPLDCVADGNELDSTRKNGTAGFGIVIRGADIFENSPVPKATASIRNNVVVGYGDESDTNHGAVHAFYTDHLIVSGNRIVEPSPYGINLLESNSDALVSDNTIIDPWSNHNGQAVAIYLRGANNSVVINDNQIYSASKRAKSIMTSGIRVANGRNRVRMGANYSSAKVMDDAGPNGPSISTIAKLSETLSRQSRGKTTFSWTASLLADGETESVDVGLASARIGDRVSLMANTTLPSCVALAGTVSSSGIVTLTLTNRCGRSFKPVLIRMLIEDWDPYDVALAPPRTLAPLFGLRIESGNCVMAGILNDSSLRI